MSGKYAVIRNPKSGLVLDATEYQVKIQHYTGFDSQLWKLEPTDAGRSIIVNKSNGKALTIEGGIVHANGIITSNKTGALNQQWYINSDGSIVSARENLALDICEERYEAGTRLLAYYKHGKPNQGFQFQYQ